MNTKILAEVFSETDLTYIQQLDERQRRLYCATRAINIGKHGVAAVYPKATAICILYDGGGSNSASHHIFKQELLKLATSRSSLMASLVREIPLLQSLRMSMHESTAVGRVVGTSVK